MRWLHTWNFGGKNIRFYLLKHINDWTLASCIQDYGSDDFYSDILKDDIINLDASAPYDAALDLFPLVFHRSDTERKSQVEVNDGLEWLPNQGFANRRIRLKRREGIGAKKLDGMQSSEKARFSSLEQWRNRLMKIASSVSYARVGIFVLFIFLALFMSSLEVFGMPKGL